MFQNGQQSCVNRHHSPGDYWYYSIIWLAGNWARSLLWKLLSKLFHCSRISEQWFAEIFLQIILLVCVKRRVAMSIIVFGTVSPRLREAVHLPILSSFLSKWWEVNQFCAVFYRHCTDCYLLAGVYNSYSVHNNRCNTSCSASESIIFYIYDPGLIFL